jgi:DNA repair protein RadC
LSSVDYGSSSVARDPAGRALPLAVDALRRDGGLSLSDHELLALVVGPRRGRRWRTAVDAVHELGGLSTLATQSSGVWWSRVPAPHRVRLAATLELLRRAGGWGTPHPYVRTPRDVFEATADLRTLRREHFVGLYLNTRNRLLARETISMGSLNASIVHPREVFEPAVRQGAASVVVVHNHPSGETDPSDDDLAITRRLVEAGDILGIALLDHVIVGMEGFTSLKEAREL